MENGIIMFPTAVQVRHAIDLSNQESERMYKRREYDVIKSIKGAVVNAAFRKEYFVSLEKNDLCDVEPRVVYKNLKDKLIGIGYMVNIHNDTLIISWASHGK